LWRRHRAGDDLFDAKHSAVNRRVEYLSEIVRFGSWLRENSEIEFVNGTFVSSSINLKNKSAGVGCLNKTMEKTILRSFRERAFSRSQGQTRT
jgi:hypothetical protein